MEINKIINEVLKNPERSSSSSCYPLFYAIARGFNCKRILDIGTHRGLSAIAFAEALKSQRFLHSEVITIEPDKDMYDDLKLNIINSGVQDYIKFLPLSSEEYLITDCGFFDLIFIDGLPKNREADFELVKNKTNLMLVHDTKRGINEWFNINKKGWTFINIPSNNGNTGMALGVKNNE